MSFCSNAKAEICRARIERSCCALSECCGILMYCSAFTPSLIRIVTASPDFAARLPKLFFKAFGLEFEVSGSGSSTASAGSSSDSSSGPSVSSSGKRSFTVSGPAAVRRVFDAFGLDPDAPSPVHINFALLESDCCRASFLRGAFLAGGSVTDPARGSHLELSTSHRAAARETCSILQELGFRPGESSRQGSTLLYFKQPEIIADVLTAAGAPVTAMDVLTARVEREMRNRVTRQINCDSANADRTVSAAQEQIDAIRRFSSLHGGLDALPEGLKEAALLRVTNPEASLADLARLSSPPVSKSCLSHRLNRIIFLASAPDPNGSK